MFEALGLDSTSESIYRALLAEPTWGVADLANHFGVSEDAVRQALDRLSRLHLLLGAPDLDGGLRPVNPIRGLGTLLSQTEAEFNRRQRQIEATRAAIELLSRQYGAGDDNPDAVQRLEGLDIVRERLTDLAMRAERECLSFVPGGAQRDDAMDASRPLDAQAIERGIAVMSLYQDSIRNDANTLRYVRWLADLGAETRTVPILPMPMVIVDRRHALVPLDTTDPRRGALLLSGPALVAAMCALFDQVWQVATPWMQRERRDEAGVSAQERELMRLLARGMTDEAAARQLGVSVRTVRRMTADLMSQLDAHSRFEAGVSAARRGWV